jgi:hypothetical protein
VGRFNNVRKRKKGSDNEKSTMRCKIFVLLSKNKNTLNGRGYFWIKGTVTLQISRATKVESERDKMKHRSTHAQ